MKHLRIKTMAVVVASALLGAPAGLQFARAAQEQESKVADLDTELAKQMEVVDSGMKKLRRSLRKAESNEESLKTIEAVHKALVKSKDLVPAMAAKVPEAERAKWVEAYKKDMDKTIKTMDELRVAVKDGKNDKAQEIYQTLKKQEDDGHKKYTEQ